MRGLILTSALFLTVAAHAAPPRPPIPPLTDADLNDPLELGQEIEARVDGDLNGDGDIDTVYIVASPDERTLYVSLAYRSEVELGRQWAGSFKLPSDRLGPADLSIAKGVLVVKDLSGGTTALSATYRYRYDPPKERMRLIGLDATVYSRTYAHDGDEMSWNLVTGDIVTTLLKVSEKDDAGYDRLYTRKWKRPSKPVYMEETPDPEFELIGATKAK